MNGVGKISYQDVKSDVLRRIRDHTWPADSLLPGEIELAQEFGCARTTVNRAMRELADEGYLDRRRKAGTRVKASRTRQAKFTISLIREEIERSGAQYRYALVKRSKVVAPDWVAARMGVPADTEMLHLICLHYADSKPFQFEDRWINLKTVPQAVQADFTLVGPNEWLVNEVPFTDAELTFSAIGATQQIAEFLATTQGTSLFGLERTTWLDAVPVTYARMYFAPGYQMTTKL